MLTQWRDECYQHHWFANTDINVREREEQRLFMKESDFKADSTSSKHFRKKDWKERESRCIHCEKYTEVEDIHSTFQ